MTGIVVGNAGIDGCKMRLHDDECEIKQGSKIKQNAINCEDEAWARF